MVALRSRRLEALLGAPLDDLRYEHLETLVTNHVPEAFDLDFKAQLYGNSERDRKDLATDVAALANTGGGLLVLGIEEDRQARAVAAPGVPVSDDEVRRILQIVGSLVVPLPVFEPLPILKPRARAATASWSSPCLGARWHLTRSSSTRACATHAVTAQAPPVPSPSREVASAYRERLAGARAAVCARQGGRAGSAPAPSIPRICPGSL